MNGIEMAILNALHKYKRIEGTAALAELINTRPELVTPAALILHHHGIIRVTIGAGRGHKTVYEDLRVMQVQR